MSEGHRPRCRHWAHRGPSLPCPSDWQVAQWTPGWKEVCQNLVFTTFCGDLFLGGPWPGALLLVPPVLPLAAPPSTPTFLISTYKKSCLKKVLEFLNNDVYLLSINPMGSRVEAIFEGRHRGESGKPGRIRYQQRCQKCQKQQLTQNHGCCHQETAWRVLPQLATWRKQNVHLTSTVSWIQPCWEVGLEALISGLIVEPSDEESSALSLGFQVRSWMSHLDAVVVLWYLHCVLVLLSVHRVGTCFYTHL